MLNHVREKIASYVKANNIKSRPARIQLAYSGGMDSSCLLDILLKLEMNCELEMFLTYINYSTSQYSKDVLDGIKNINISDLNKNIYSANISNKDNFESEARYVRYNFLNKVHIKNKIDFTFTAHHFNDQIETVVMKFIDGSDYVSLQGIRSDLGFIYRPILDLNKEDVIEYALSNKVVYFEDPSNVDISFVRNKVRKFIMPILLKDSFLANKIKQINDVSIKKFNVTKIKINQNLNSLNFNNRFRYTFIDMSQFEKYDLIESKLYLTAILNKFFKIQLKSKNKSFWKEVCRFIEKSKTGSIFELSENILILKNREGFFIYDDNLLKEIKDARVRLESDFNWGFGKISCLEANIQKNNIKDEIFVDKKTFNEGLYIRKWRHGDRIVNKKISDLLIKMKIPLFIKQKYPIIEDSKGNIIWVPGGFFDPAYKPKREGKKISWME